MKGITIRFAADLHDILTEEAERAGVNLTSYIREAAVARALIARAHRGYYTGSEDLHEALRIYLAAGRQPPVAAQQPTDTPV